MGKEKNYEICKKGRIKNTKGGQLALT